MNRHFQILYLYGLKPHFNVPITTITLLWFTGGSKSVLNDYTLLQYSCWMQLCLEFSTEEVQAALSMFVPAIPAESPSRGSCPPPRPAAAAGTGTTPPGGERWSCTAKGKKETSVTLKPETALTAAAFSLKKIPNVSFDQRQTITGQAFK